MTDLQFDSCMERVCNKDKTALQEIYEEYLPFIFHTIKEVLGNRENAEDVTSDFFIKIWGIASGYQPGNGHRAWMATIARNMAIDFLRKRKKEELVDLQENGQEMEDSHQKTMGDSQGSEVEAEVVESLTIQETLSVLNEGEREIINLKILGDLTFKEIASVLSMPMGTVTWKYQNAVKKIRRCGYEQGF